MKNRKQRILLVSAFLIFLPSLTQANVALYNPLVTVKSFPDLVNNVISGILGVIGAIALVMIVIGGVQWMTSGGNADRIRRGKDTLIWSIFGLLAIFVSYALIKFIFDALSGS